MSTAVSNGKSNYESKITSYDVEDGKIPKSALAGLQGQKNEKSWAELSSSEKLRRVIANTMKILAVMGFMYLFICSLGFLADAFRLIAGRVAGNVFQNEYLDNPVVGLVIGILLTVLVQSSSTSTSIIVSLVSTELLGVHAAIPMIMGSNIGTSVTNTIVSLTQVGNVEEFRRAFAGATVHDMFNWLTVIVLLTVEVLTSKLFGEGMLEHFTGSIIASFNFDPNKGGKVKILKHITDPFTKLIIRIDSKMLSTWSTSNSSLADNATLIPQFCKFEEIEVIGLDHSVRIEKVGIPDSCNFLFYNTGLTDRQIGLILLILSLVMLCGALILVVKLLNSMLKGSIAIVIKKTLNSDIPYVPWLTGYLALLIGAVMTVIVQSSSIFTSTLTPLVGLDLITVERAYPLTLGSNIGTTTTALLASIAGSGKGLKYSLQIALVHLFFNIFGIIIFYPIPFMRLPIPLAKALGNITAKYRWFAIFYLVSMFFLFPATVFLMSMGGVIVIYVVLGPIVLLLIFVGIINVLQKRFPSILPDTLKSWEFLPLPLRSLKPYDRAFTSLPCCKKCQAEDSPEDSLPQRIVVYQSPGKKPSSGGIDNASFTSSRM